MVTTIVILTRLNDTQIVMTFCNDLDDDKPSIVTITTATPTELGARPEHVPQRIGEVRHYTV